jgi:hypothetical protein
MRLLDIDLDFFVEGTAHWKSSDSERLDGDDFPPWRLEDAMNFLERQCGLAGKLPGFVVEHHGALFDLWRDAIQSGVIRPPLAVTHVDAHADLGLGDAGYIYLLTTLVNLPLEERANPQRGDEGLGDGNYLAFAIANRWLDDLTYVFNTDDDRPGDLMIPVLENFDRDSHHIQLEPRTREEIDQGLRDTLPPLEELHEPRVPLTFVPWKEFRAPASFDVVCLARSPAYTPPAADSIFDEIRERFIDETAFVDAGS